MSVSRAYVGRNTLTKSENIQVTKKIPEEIGALARDGAYIFGLFLEGASWDSRTSSLEVNATHWLFSILLCHERCPLTFTCLACAECKEQGTCLSDASNLDQGGDSLRGRPGAA